MTQHHFTIHITTADDAGDIREVETRAFGFEKEANLVAELLADETARPMLSLLAKHDGKAVGHILFTRATFKGRTDAPMMHILAPLAVIPEYQKMGVGGLLIRSGIEHLREMGSKRVYVLGHHDYYPRHGFIPGAGNLGYPAPYPIPEAVKSCWMVQKITPGEVAARGDVQCVQSLMKPEHWRE